MRKLLSSIPILLCMLFFALAIKYVVTYKPKLPPKIKMEANIAKDVAPHVVPFRNAKYEYVRTATGFYLKFKGKTYIMTNRHVCDSSIDGKHVTFGEYLAEIIVKDEYHDLCLVTSNREEGLVLAEEQGKPFEDIYLVGYPRGIGKVIRKGSLIEKITINAGWLTIANPNVESYWISATAYGGNSGSPVVNKYGEVIGVLFAGDPRSATEGLIVPLKYVKAFLYEAVFGVIRI